MEVLVAGTTLMVCDPFAIPDVLTPRTHVVCDVFAIELGVGDGKTAAPPVMVSAKSAASKSSAPLEPV